MKVDVHQGSVLSPLLFAAVMDVVSSEARSGLPSELLYADDLVIMAPTMEQLGRWVADWRASLLDKGSKVDAGKSKVMVGSSGGKLIVNSGKWPCCCSLRYLWKVTPIFRSLQNCQFHHRRLESLEHFNVLYIYIILSTMVSHFWTLRMPFFLQGLPFLYTFPFLQVHFTCVLCI